MSNEKYSRDGLFRPQYTFLVAGGAGFICIVQQLEECHRTFSISSGNGGTNCKVFRQRGVLVLSQNAKVINQMMVLYGVLPAKTSVNCFKGRTARKEKDKEEKFVHVFCQSNWCKCLETISLKTKDIWSKKFTFPYSVLRGVIKKGIFTVRLTVRVDPPPPPPYGQVVVIFSK